jgi:hypothetical protein
MPRATSAQWHGFVRCFMGSIWVLSILAGAPFLASAAVQPAAPLKLGEIIQALEAHGERAGAVAVRWREVAQFKTGGLVSPLDAEGLELEGNATRTGIPSRDLRVEFPGELLLKGTWMRLSTKNCAQGSRPENTIDDSITGYDGVESRSLVVDADGLRTGAIMTRAENMESHSARIMPLLLYFRAFSEPFNMLDKSAMRIKNADSVSKGRHCIVVSDGHKVVWVDPSRSCLPLVIEEYRPDGLRTLRAEVEYAEHDQLFWVPARYRVECYDIAKPTKVGVCYEVSDIVVKAALPLAQSDFALVFSPGTEVYDGRDGMRYKVGADGGKLLLSGRRSAKLSLATSPPSHRWSYILCANAICLVGLFSGWFYFQRQRKKR